MENARRNPLFEEKKEKLDVIDAVNAINFILSWLTEDDLSRYKRMEIAIIAGPESDKPHKLDIPAIARSAGLSKTTARTLLRTRFRKQGWTERDGNDYVITEKGLKHAAMTDRTVRKCAVDQFSRIPKAYQVGVYNAMRLIGIGMTGSEEMRNLSDLVIMTKGFEYMNEVRMFQKTYYAGQAHFVKAVSEAGRLTCSAYCSGYVPYKSRQNIKFLLLRLIEKGYLAYVGSLDRRGALSIHGDLVVTAQGKRFLSEVTAKAEKAYEDTSDLPYSEESIDLIKTGLEALATLGKNGIMQRWYEIMR